MGFTLVELLVVIAIMGFLMSVLTPVLQRVKMHARAIKCGSNIRQLLYGLLEYESQNDSLPAAFDVKPEYHPPVDCPGFSEYE